MKSRILLFAFTFLITAYVQVNAQVSGISYTLSPAIQYTWWDDKAGLDDGLLYGGKLGLGFGENLELRGSYMKSLDLKTSFKDFGIPNFADSLYTSRDVNLTRWGGELKANLSRGALLPFLTLGTGVQSIKLDSFDANKNIYASLGLGLKLSLGDRSTLTIEGRNTQYNLNAGKRLLTTEDKEALGVSDGDFKSNRLSNWSLGASLQFYLGGRRPGQMSELDKAYYNSFASGMSGLRIPIEPTLAKMNFHNSLPYRDTWMGGGYAGFDFGPYVGVRGFYFKAMEKNEINLNFEDLAMYGGELRLRTNLSKGLTPVLTLGGGYLDVGNKYVPQDTVQAESQAFASGGVSVNLPVSSSFILFGGVRGILTANSDPEDLASTDQIQTSWMYNMGVKLSLGKKAEAPQAVFKSEMESALTEQQMTNEAEKEQIRLESQQLKMDYENKIVDFEKQLNEAYAKQDIEKAASLLREKDKAEQVVKELEAREQERIAKENAKSDALEMQQQNAAFAASGSRISMSPAEFQNLIEEILENMGDKGQRIAPAVEQGNLQSALQMQDMGQRLGDIEKTLIRMEERQGANLKAGQVERQFSDTLLRRDMTEFSARLLVEMQKLNEKVEKNAAGSQTGTVGQPAAGGTGEDGEIPPAVLNPSVTQGNVLGVKTGGNYIVTDSSVFSLLVYEGMSGFAGFNFGGQTTMNIGLRWHYGIGKSDFEFMPETFFGFGSPASFGITGNFVLPVVIKKLGPVTPYLGAGAGFMQIAKDGDDKLRLNYNFIFGTYLNVGKGRFYVDLTARNLFKYNQLIAGYRFPF
ncbi:MAG: hypothetical protein K9J37_04350 [Saprospiraceae bacterium]|nr:hypothetical protein [Saprospiraceae bacterium]MCF8249116.1 hypothetical protein [Saprospiraceae bacterium]MCF8281373.1 hypothetical protein [Bacteroidales bacterium]MCF8311138.1 hypothetical protein [Saprospiraceae bacterium]MCF8440228.1 hypothetical protein [Saprospiraceae bacterium]